MRKFLKLLLIIIIIIPALLISLLFSLSNSYIATNYFLKAINKTFQTNIKAEQVNISFIDSHFQLKNFSCHSSDSEFHISNAKELDVKLNFYELLKGRLYIEKLRLDGANFSLNMFSNTAKKKKKNKLYSTLQNNLADSLPGFLSYNINDMRLTNISGKLTFGNNNSLDIGKTDIYIPRIKPDTRFDLVIKNCKTKYSSSFSELEILTGRNVFQVTSYLNKELYPTKSNISFSSNNIKTFVHGEKTCIPKIKVSSIVSKNNDKINLKNFRLEEIVSEGKRISIIKLNGSFTYPSCSLNFDIGLTPMSNPLFNIIASSFLKKRYEFSSLKYKGKLAHKSGIFASSGKITIDNLNFGSNTTPLDTGMNYSITYDSKKRRLSVKELSLKLKKNGTPLLSASISNNLFLTFLKHNIKVSSDMCKGTLNIKNFNLKKLKKLIPFETLPYIKDISGRLSTNIKFSGSKEDYFEVKSSTDIDNLSLTTKDRLKYSDISFSNKANLNVHNLQIVNLVKGKTKITENGRPILEALYSGNYDLKKHYGTLSLKKTKIYPDSISLLPVSNELRKNILDQLSSLSKSHIKAKSKISFDLLNKLLTVYFLNTTFIDNNTMTAYLSIYSPTEIKRDNGKYSIKTPPSHASIIFNDFNLSNLRSLFRKYSPNITKGILSGYLYLIPGTGRNQLNIKGELDTENAYIKYKQREFKDLDVKQKIDITVTDFRDIKFNKVKTASYFHEKPLSSFVLDGTLSKAGRQFNINLKDAFISLKNINMLSSGFFNKTTGIKTLDLEGEINITNNQKQNNITVKSNLSGSNLKFSPKVSTKSVEKLSGLIETEFTYSKKNIHLKGLNLSLKKDKTKLGDLNGSGTIKLPLKENKSILKLALKNVKLKKALRLWKKLNFQPPSTGTALKDINFDIEFDADNISYANELNIDLHTNILKKGKSYSVRPILAKINNADLFATFNREYEDNNNSFALKCKISNLNIRPLLKIYRPSFYSDSTKGSIDMLEMNLSGKDLTEASLKKFLKGKLTASVNNISLKDNIVNFDLIRLLFIPFEVVSQSEQLVSNLLIPNFFNNLFNYSNRIFSNTEQLKLSKGSIDIDIRNSKADINKLWLKSLDKTFSSLSFTGSIYFDETLDLHSSININKNLSLPINITGTVSSPNTDIISFVSLIRYYTKCFHTLVLIILKRFMSL
ncbi:MAG: hypothetical protein K9L78_04895, partial [Victivallales bacterium]|nr:hypothetical protein [Victivallales bacterium]